MAQVRVKSWRSDIHSLQEDSMSRIRSVYYAALYALLTLAAAVIASGAPGQWGD